MKAMTFNNENLSETINNTIERLYSLHEKDFKDDVGEYRVVVHENGFFGTILNKLIGKKGEIPRISFVKVVTEG